MPAVNPEKLPLFLQHSSTSIDMLYVPGMTWPAIESTLESVLKYARTLVLTTPDGPAHDAAIRYLAEVKKVIADVEKLTKSFRDERAQQFDRLRKSLSDVEAALPDDVRKTASLYRRIARVRKVLTAHAH